jgi:hypothetical protein
MLKSPQLAAVTPMKSPTIHMLRAYLMTASFAAMSLEVGVLVSLEVFGVPEQVFGSAAFRLCACFAIVGAVLVTKCVANLAYRSAVEHRYTKTTKATKANGANVQSVAVSPACPVRTLVILHLRFNRRMVDLAGW